MMNKVRCRHCGYTQATRESSVGSIQRCRACGEKIFIKEARTGFLGWIVLLIIGGVIWLVLPSRSVTPPPSSPPVSTPPVARPVVSNPPSPSPPVAFHQPEPTPIRPSASPTERKRVSSVPSTAEVVKRNLEKTKKALEHYTPTINTNPYGEKASDSP